MFANKNDNFSEILDEVSLPKSILQEFPSNLSIGVRKRIGLARAILQNPEILILDEPTTGLDPIIGKQINLLIKTLVKKKLRQLQLLTIWKVSMNFQIILHLLKKEKFLGMVNQKI